MWASSSTGWTSASAPVGPALSDRGAYGLHDDGVTACSSTPQLKSLKTILTLEAAGLEKQTDGRTVESCTTPRPCSIADTLAVVGEKYSLLVLREVFFGVRRFNDMARNIGAPRDVLTARLNHLVEAGVLEKVPYSQRPPRYEYRPTDGRPGARSVLLTLLGWGDRHLADRPPVVFEHTCGDRLRGDGRLPVVRRRVSSRLSRPATSRPRAGPGGRVVTAEPSAPATPRVRAGGRSDVVCEARSASASPTRSRSARWSMTCRRMLARWVGVRALEAGQSGVGEHGVGAACVLGDTERVRSGRRPPAGRRCGSCRSVRRRTPPRARSSAAGARAPRRGA